jgi:alpha-N-arabinofuranosidase
LNPVTLTSRRSFSKALAAAAWTLRAQSPPARARIRIDTERVIGDIDPKIYGNFVEHLGRCVQGGVFDEGSPLADANGYRRDVLEASKKLGVTLVRWPGGNFSSNYNWKDGIVPGGSKWPGEQWKTIASAPMNSCSLWRC